MLVAIELSIMSPKDNFGVEAFAELELGLAQLEISYTAVQFKQLCAYTNLLSKWNKVYNLTAITNLAAMIRLHLLDGLAILQYVVTAGAILDVGSGMGVPGVLLAIMLPQNKVCLVDSNSKKTAFLQQVKIELGLKNLAVVTGRVEDYHSETPFTIITSRAVADLGLLLKLSQHLLAPAGHYLALKGELGLTELPQIGEFRPEILAVRVPFLAAQRFLIKMMR